MRIGIKRTTSFLFVFLLTLSFFFPADHINTAITIIRMTTIGLAVFFAVIEVANNNGIKNHIITICLAYFSVMFFTSLFNAVPYANESTVLSIVRLFVFLLCISFFLQNVTKTAVLGIFLAIFIIVVWDLVGIITNPSGLFRTEVVIWGNEYHSSAQWLLGNKNNHSIFFVLILFLAYWLHRLYLNRITGLLCVIVAISVVVGSIILYSATSLAVVIVCSTGLLLSLLERKQYNSLYEITRVKCITIYVVSFLMNIFVLSGFTFFLSPLVEGVFKKDLTFSSRTKVWSAVFRIITEHPLMGIGNVDSNDLVERCGLYEAFNAHNQFLDSYLRGGIVLFLLTLLLFFVVAKCVDGMRYSNESKMIKFVFLSIMIKMITEQLLGGYLSWFLLAILIEYIYCFNSKTKNENEQMS